MRAKGKGRKESDEAIKTVAYVMHGKHLPIGYVSHDNDNNYYAHDTTQIFK